jgi:hypothetical protein
MAINDDYFTGKCRHTEKEIRDYKDKHKTYLKVSLGITGVVILAYVVYFIYQKM